LMRKAAGRNNRASGYQRWSKALLRACETILP
jgi:hypothetical protein